MEVKGLTDTITDSITDYLRAQIITGGLTPGERLNEVDLASRLNVSRSPLREALRNLAREHLVVNNPRKGTYVTRISLEDLAKTFEAREIYELYAINTLKRKNITKLPQVASALSQSVNLADSSLDDWRGVFVHQRIITDFHYKLVESLDNPYVSEFYRIIAARLARYQYLKFSKPGEREHSVKDHQQILSYIERGEHDDARQCLEAHLQYTYELLRESVANKMTR